MTLLQDQMKMSVTSDYRHPFLCHGKPSCWERASLCSQREADTRWASGQGQVPLSRDNEPTISNWKHLSRIEVKVAWHLVFFFFFSFPFDLRITLMITALQSAELDWPIHTEMISGVLKALYSCPVRGRHQSASWVAS